MGQPVHHLVYIGSLLQMRRYSPLKYRGLFHRFESAFTCNIFSCIRSSSWGNAFIFPRYLLRFGQRMAFNYHTGGQNDQTKRSNRETRDSFGKGSPVEIQKRNRKIKKGSVETPEFSAYVVSAIDRYYHKRSRQRELQMHFWCWSGSTSSTQSGRSIPQGGVPSELGT